jgi:predicted AlkP superfamily phosphohydrolase/phosphomutase
LSILLAAVLGLAAPGPSRVILVSLDGAGYAMTSRLLAEGKLPNLARMLREGAWSDGMVTSFPTKTASAHALLFTGRHGHANGVTGNAVLTSSGSRLEARSGFFSDALRAEPVWASAASRGLETWVFHAPQVYPFRTQTQLNVVYGYTRAVSPGEVLRSDANDFRFAVGETSFRGTFRDDPGDPAVGCDSFDLFDDQGAAVVRLKPGNPFSPPIAASVHGEEVWFSLRLFELSPDCEKRVLYRSGATSLATSPDTLLEGEPPGLRAFAGNGGTRAYSQGDLGVTIPRGGAGEAERRLLETEHHLAAQILEQARFALSRDYRLVLLYSPVVDDVAHEIYAYLAPELDGYDVERARKLWPVMEEAFAIQDRLLGMLLEVADSDGAHVIVVSDHGMTGTDRLLHLNAALEKAGLLTFAPDGSIDLARTRALAPPLEDSSIAVNSVDRPGGVVPLEERAQVIEEARRALASLRDPDTGEPVVTAFFDPSTSGLLQPGGLSTGDLFLDLASGYYPSSSASPSPVIERTEPSGEHGFPPTRREMLAIFAACGPRIPKGVNLGRVKAVDVAPTILDLLGVEPASDLPGRSLVPGRGTLNR